jgi:hypothetical protein
MDFILFSVIFPTLCLSLEDITLFSSDPVEFVRKIHDPSEDWLDPRIAAVSTQDDTFWLSYDTKSISLEAPLM